MCNETIAFVEYDLNFLDKSWHWLNDPEIKELTLTLEFTREQQHIFFETLPSRSDYKIWGINCNDEKIGVAGLKKITKNNAEYFGYIGERIYWNKGLSINIFEEIFKIAKDFKLKEIYLNVSSKNFRAINAYNKNGFIIDESKSDGDNLHMKVGID